MSEETLEMLGMATVFMAFGVLGGIAWYEIKISLMRRAAGRAVKRQEDRARLEKHPLPRMGEDGDDG